MKMSDYPYCPYCEEEYDTNSAGLEEDGDTDEVQCGSCDKLFKIELYVEVLKTYDTYEMEQPEPEEKKPVDVPNQTYFSFFDLIGV